jgi:hypothetical protein
MPIDKEPLCDGSSFKFIVGGFGKKISTKEQLDIIHKFKGCPLWDKCPLSLDDAKRIFTVLLDYGKCGFQAYLLVTVFSSCREWSTQKNLFRIACKIIPRKL